MDYSRSLVELKNAVGLLLDGPQNDQTDAMDNVISAYDECNRHLHGLSRALQVLLEPVAQQEA